MPNWCDNDLTVCGDAGELRRFIKAIRGDEPHKNEERSDYRRLDFRRIIPYPARFARMDADAQTMPKKAYEKKYKTWRDGFNSGGYEWCIANWGTKWNASDVHLDDSTSSKPPFVFIRFSTAWCPPRSVIYKLISMFPKLEFSLMFYECGVGFKGCIGGKGGKVVKDFTGGYDGDRGG